MRGEGKMRKMCGILCGIKRRFVGWACLLLFRIAGVFLWVFEKGCMRVACAWEICFCSTTLRRRNLVQHGTLLPPRTLFSARCGRDICLLALVVEEMKREDKTVWLMN